MIQKRNFWLFGLLILIFDSFAFSRSYYEVKLTEEVKPLSFKINNDLALLHFNSECESEYNSGAEVCLEVRDTDLVCTEEFSGNSYRECQVVVDYLVKTDHRGEAALSVDIECEAEISYMGEDGFYSHDSQTASDSVKLYANDYKYEQQNLEFYFGSFSKVQKVSVDDVSCKITKVDLDVSFF